MNTSKLRITPNLFAAIAVGTVAVELGELDAVVGEIPEEWLRKNLELFLTPEEMAMIEAMGGPEALRERFHKLFMFVSLAVEIGASLHLLP